MWKSWPASWVSRPARSTATGGTHEPGWPFRWARKLPPKGRMMSDDPLERAWAVFDQLADVPPERRKAALEAACGDERSLHTEVEKLLALDAQLAASEGAQGFLRSPLIRRPNRPDPTSGASPPEAKLRIPEHIGRYRVLRLLRDRALG